MVAMPHLYEMKYSKTTVSRKYWTNKTFENRFLRQFPVHCRQINIIKSRLIWMLRRSQLKIGCTGWNFWRIYAQTSAIENPGQVEYVFFVLL